MLEFLMMGGKRVLSDGGQGFALFGGGFSSTVLATVEKYAYANDAVAPGTALTNARDRPAAASNYTEGLFLSGTSTNIASGGAHTFVSSTERYTFATDVRSNASGLSNPRLGSAGAGNTILAMFAGGTSASGITGYVDRFAYAENTRSVGTALGTIKTNHCAFGTATVGHFAAGNNVTASTATYSYSDYTTAPGTNMMLARNGLTAAGTPTFAIVTGGGGVNGNKTEKRAYAGNVSTTGTSLSVLRNFAGGAGNAQVGIFAGGVGPLTSSDRYTFASDTVAAGGNLGTGRGNTAGMSSMPGGF